MEYTLGFIFDPKLQRVVLMEKQKPAWQKGKLNGVGGKVEEGEANITCMVRESREECGIHSDEGEWMQIAVLSGTDWRMSVYGLVCSELKQVRGNEREGAVAWYDVDDIPAHALSNVPWLVQMAKDKLMNRAFHEVAVLYP